jgi:UDP-N-acetylglucosamine 2-epimerase
MIPLLVSVYLLSIQIVFHVSAGLRPQAEKDRHGPKPEDGNRHAPLGFVVALSLGEPP